MANDLQTIVQESGLEKSKAQYILDNFQNYFDIAAEWEKRAKTLVVTDASQEVEMKLARTGRLFLKEKRLAIEKSRKELKEQSLREGKAIDGIANVLKALIVPVEEYLEKQEKFVELKEEAEREARRQEIERRMEEERIENERLDAVAKERKLVASEYRQFWPKEEPDFRGMSQEVFEKGLALLKKQKKDYEDEQARIKAENERLKQEAEAAERKAKEEKARQEKILAEEKAKSEAERKRQEEALRKQKEEAERIQREADAKAKAERDALEAKAQAGGRGRKSGTGKA